SAIHAATIPSAATREAALLALLPSFTRRISSARARSPPASVSAFLHSIIGASVFSRSSLTMLAVIAVIGSLPRFLVPSLVLALDLDELFLVGRALGHFL